MRFTNAGRNYAGIHRLRAIGLIGPNPDRPCSILSPNWLARAHITRLSTSMRLAALSAPGHWCRGVVSVAESILDLCWLLPDLLQIEFVGPNCLGHRLHFNRRAQRIASFCFLGSPESKASVPPIKRSASLWERGRSPIGAPRQVGANKSIKEQNRCI